MDKDYLSLYRHMVLERHTIWRKRMLGDPGPWTDDPVLANLKMTNMFRVLDPGSQFVFDLEDEDDRMTTISRLVFYRITNLPATWLAMEAAMGRFPTVDDFLIGSEVSSFLDAYRNDGNKIFSGAYIIIPNPGVVGSDKMVDAVGLVRHFVEEKAEAFLEAKSPAEQYRLLRSTKGLGNFLSMQILTDWSYLQDEEPDPTFVIAGPGARRGAALIDSRGSEETIHGLTLMWDLRDEVLLENRSLTAMDVQNTLCEFSKYAREIETPRKKTRYRPAHPGPQPQPVLPRWW